MELISIFRPTKYIALAVEGRCEISLRFCRWVCGGQHDLHRAGAFHVNCGFAVIDSLQAVGVNRHVSGAHSDPNLAPAERDRLGLFVGTYGRLSLNNCCKEPWVAFLV
jgi:hypothetical protein